MRSLHKCGGGEVSQPIEQPAEECQWLDPEAGLILRKDPEAIANNRIDPSGDQSSKKVKKF